MGRVKKDRTKEEIPLSASEGILLCFVTVSYTEFAQFVYGILSATGAGFESGDRKVCNKKDKKNMGKAHSTETEKNSECLLRVLAFAAFTQGKMWEQCLNAA